MKTDYNGIEITYDEKDDRWKFELRGRSRSADTLSKAKEAIDKEPKEKRTQTFPRFQAYRWRYDGLTEVTVTSVAEGYGGLHFWVTEGDKRSKESANSLYPVNEYNTAIIGQIKAKADEIDRLSEEKRKLHEKLKKAELPKEIAA